MNTKWDRGLAIFTWRLGCAANCSTSGVVALPNAD